MLRNAAIPITTITGITIASLIALAAVVERAFSLNGLGAYLVAPRPSKDFAVVQGISLVLVTAFVVVEHDRRRALRGARPACRAGEPRDVSAGPAVPASTPATRRRLVGARPPTGAVGIASAIVIVVALVIAIIGPAIAPHDPKLGRLSISYVGPSAGHLLGFDGQGRDLLSRLLVGARTSMLGPLAVVAICMRCGRSSPSLGVAARDLRRRDLLGPGHPVRVPGHPAGGARRDRVRRRAHGRGARARRRLHAVHRPRAARRRPARAEPAYIAALEVQGASALSICTRHLVPNMAPLIVAQATILFGYAMVDLAAISFIGLGVQPPEADWGVMVSANQSGVLQGYPVESLSAGLCIVVVVVAVNLLGERLYEQAQAERR